MASPPSDPVFRLALPLSDPRRGAGPGPLARAAADAVAQRGTGLATRSGEAGPIGVPSGAWSSDEAEPELDPIVRANPALAAYAAQLRARRATRVVPHRGLPMTVRRSTATAPGALARRSAPVERAEDPDVAAAVRGRRPTAPAPTPRRASR